MTGNRKPYRLISHTGDLGLEVWGNDLPDLFTKAAWAFMDTFVEARTIEASQSQTITAEAPDQETLLVAWLGELLYRFDARHLVFGRFEMEELSDQFLRATAWGEKYHPEKHRFKTAVKAVTYHQLRLWRARKYWHARIILDV